jgi:hypothetical protein
MVDISSPRVPLTVHLPAELIEELQILAQEQHLPVDDVIMEACLGYTEPYGWERDYKGWLGTHPKEGQESGIDGEEIGPAEKGEDRT